MYRLKNVASHGMCNIQPNKRVNLVALIIRLDEK